MLVQFAVFVTIAGSTAAWAASECWTLLRPSDPDTGPRALWTLGALLMVAHSIAAFGVFYGWSHAAAVAATAHQTEAVTGLSWGGGLVVNYMFIGIWIADAAWRWTHPISYRVRSRALAQSVRALFVFMFLNGAIVFADGAMRFLGAASVSLVVVAWYRSIGKHD